MSLISDEIIDLLNGYRLEELKQVKSKLSEEEYAQSKHNIVSSRDDDSQNLENILNEIKDNDVLAKVVHSLKNSIEARNYHNYLDGNGKIKVESVRKDIEQIQTNLMAHGDSTTTNVAEEAVAALTASELHSIAEDFKNQSFEMRSMLLNQWYDLSFEDRSTVINAEMEELHSIAENDEQHSSIDSLGKALNAHNRVQEDFSKSQEGLTEEERCQAIKEHLSEHPGSPETELYKYYRDVLNKSEYEAVRLVIEDLKKSGKYIHNYVNESVENGHFDPEVINKEAGKISDITFFFSGITKKFKEIKVIKHSNELNSSLEILQSVNNVGSLESSGIASAEIEMCINFFKKNSDIPLESFDKIIKKSPFRDTLEKAKQLYLQEENQELQEKAKEFNQQPIPDKNAHKYYHSQATDLTLDRNVEEVAKKIQAQGGSVEEISVELAKTIEKTKAEQAQHSSSEEQPKGQETESSTPPILENPTITEDHSQESTTSPKSETPKETEQSTAIAKPDNSFIGKIRRVFANMKDTKNKDNSKGFFARLGASIKTVFGNNDEYSEKQDSTSTVTEAKNQSQAPTRKDSSSYFNQHIEVNTNEAVQKTEESKQESSKEDDRDSR